MTYEYEVERIRKSAFLILSGIIFGVSLMLAMESDIKAVYLIAPIVLMITMMAIWILYGLSLLRERRKKGDSQVDKLELALTKQLERLREEFPEMFSETYATRPNSLGK